MFHDLLALGNSDWCHRRLHDWLKFFQGYLLLRVILLRFIQHYVRLLKLVLHQYFFIQSFLLLSSLVLCLFDNCLTSDGDRIGLAADGEWRVSRLFDVLWHQNLLFALFFEQFFNFRYHFVLFCNWCLSA